MISQLFIQMVKYAFGFLVVAMVSHIPAKSRMAVKHVMEVGASWVSGARRGILIFPGLSHDWVRFIVSMEAEFALTGYSYGCCGRGCC